MIISDTYMCLVIKDLYKEIYFNKWSLHEIINCKSLFHQVLAKTILNVRPITIWKKKKIPNILL